MKSQQAAVDGSTSVGPLAIDEHGCYRGIASAPLNVSPPTWSPQLPGRFRIAPVVDETARVESDPLLPSTALRQAVKVCPLLTRDRRLRAASVACSAINGHLPPRLPVRSKQKTPIERSYVDDLADRRAFYLEFAPVPEHAGFVEHLYAMKDRGIMTADRRTFASPFMEIAFLFARSPDGSECTPRIIVREPSFGHRTKKRPFHGWMFGIKFRFSLRGKSLEDLPSLVQGQKRLHALLSNTAPISCVVEVLDRLCGDFMPELATLREPAQCLGARTVAEIAARQMRSTRTVHRRMTAATGLSPKRLLGIERFRRAVREIPEPGTRLSELADTFGFADQAHMTREFRRHAGLSPGEFQRTWCGARGEIVRFVQDDASASRLRLVVLASPGGEHPTD